MGDNELQLPLHFPQRRVISPRPDLRPDLPTEEGGLLQTGMLVSLPPRFLVLQLSWIFAELEMNTLVNNQSENTNTYRGNNTKSKGKQTDNERLTCHVQSHMGKLRGACPYPFLQAT